MNWVDKLIDEYVDGKHTLEKKRETLTNSELDKLDRTQLNSMINEMAETITWLQTGRDPQEMRGVNVKDIYRLRYLSNMDLLPDITSNLPYEREKLELSDEQKEVMIRIFASLSDRERDCFIMHITQDLSMNEIAKKYGISKSAVQIYITRAKNKIERIVKKAS